jgi:hypothetical protein
LILFSPPFEPANRYQRSRLAVGSDIECTHNTLLIKI